MAKSADARDLKSLFAQAECGFKSRPGHHYALCWKVNLLTRRRLLAELTSATASFAQQSAPRFPNIVLILADDLGARDLGCYGADLHETPRLDALAREGVRFTQALSSAPVCSPTRAALMTGKHPARLGITIWHEGAVGPPPANRPLSPAPAEPNLPHAEVTIAERLKEAGYATAAVGKWHLGTAPFYPETQGFDINIGGTFWGAPATFFHPYRGKFNTEIRYIPGLAGGAAGEYLTDRLTDEAIKTIDLMSADRKPFFLYLAHHAPHTPIEAKPAMVAKYEAKRQPEMRHQNAAYAAMVESFDESVGRVMDHLRTRGLDRDTIVIVTSDNGGYINEFRGKAVTNNAPLRSGKGSLYEGGLRVPLLIKWPGVTQPGAESAEPVVSADLFATLCEAAGVGAKAVDGVTLKPLLTREKAQLDREELYFHYPHYYPTTTPVSAVRTRDWKLLEYYEDGRLELYHLREDPGEQRNAAAAEPERTRAMKARLDAWKRDVGARLPTRRQ